MGHCLCPCLPPTPSQSPYPANYSVPTPISPPPSNIQKPSDMAASNIHNGYIAHNTELSASCRCCPILKSSPRAAGAVAEHGFYAPSQYLCHPSVLTEFIVGTSSTNCRGKSDPLFKPSLHLQPSFVTHSQ